MEASNFWGILDTNEVTREEFVLVASYLVASWKRNGFEVVAEKFVKEANFVEVKEIGESNMVYYQAFTKGRPGMDYWTFYCHEKLMLERLKGTQTNQQLLTVDQISSPKINTLCKLSKYMENYACTNYNIIAAASLFNNGCDSQAGGINSFWNENAV